MRSAVPGHVKPKSGSDGGTRPARDGTVQERARMLLHGAIDPGTLSFVALREPNLLWRWERGEG
ncbi:MAG TPA: hypothetical protein VFS67_10200 [Polyangiaceae bacterium]|nr:hypothetical protein [Polyangiaceae bacterium]